MLSILLSWCYILFISTGFGIGFSKSAKLDLSKTPTFVFLNGLFAYTVFAWLFSYLFAINAYFYALGIFINSLLIIKHKTSVISIFSDLKQKFKSFRLGIKISFGIIFLLALAQSSTCPSLPDNSSYYVQTIKWLNEYGLVKGLINLHPFLGQTSAWHILQSAFGFGFLGGFWGELLNDLNAYIFLITVFFSLDKLNQYIFKKSTHQTLLSFGLLPVLSILLFKFMDSPSPDLPVILIAQIIFFLFISNFEKININDYKEILILSVFLVLIKLTALPILLLTFVLWAKHRVVRNRTKFTLLLLAGAFMLLVSKNYILTGYVFYPFSLGTNWFEADWKYPEILMHFMQQTGKTQSLALSWNQNVFHNFYMWLQQTGWHKFFNTAYVFLLVIFPFMIRNINNKKAYLTIYLFGLFQFVTLLFISPQYRFFLYFFIFFILVLLSLFLSKKLILPVLFSGIFVAGISVLPNKTNKFSEINMLLPNPNASFNGRYLKHQVQNFEYYYPDDDDDFFWETENAPLPAVHRNLIDYFKENFGTLPQRRTRFLKDGFKTLIME